MFVRRNLWDLLTESGYMSRIGTVVTRVGSKARVVDASGSVVIETEDHVDAWKRAVEATPSHGTVVGIGEFVFDESVSVTKPLTIVGGVFIRDPSVGSNSHTFFNVGNQSDEPLVEGPIRFINCVFDGNERNITKNYTEASGAPVHTGINVLRLRKLIIEGCKFRDMAREAIWITTVTNQSGVIDHEEIIITNNFFENVGYGITAESYAKLIVTNNVVRGLNAGSAGASVSNPNYFVSINYLDCHHTVIANNVVDGEVPSGYPYEGSWGFTAVKKGGTVTAYSTNIVGNTLTHLKAGIYIVPPKTNIIGNYIYDVSNGIMTSYAKYVHIIGNVVRRFTSNGIYIDGDATNPAEGTIIAYNVVDDDGMGAQYGIHAWYAKRCIVMFNAYLGSISTPHYVWVGPNCTSDGVAGSLTDLTNDLPNFPFLRGMVPMLYYDGTYYYLVIVDLVNKAIRKVQLS